MDAYVFPSGQVVRGLGETLVGAYPGRALSFICKKKDLNSPQVSIGVCWVFQSHIYLL